MKRTLLIVVALAASSCATIEDGAFEQREGHPIDYAALDFLVEREATGEEVLEAIGEPTSRSADSNSVEQWTYVSVKQREAIERTLGIVTNRSSQTMTERAVLVFKNGLLHSAQRSYEVQDGN